MRSEIGSEFWDSGPQKKNSVYLLSGRTALDFILRDILKTRTVQLAHIPSYCCHTMVEPFFRNGVSVKFYDVFIDGKGRLTAELPEVEDNEIFYYMTYFGFRTLNGLGISGRTEHSVVCIEDMTHSCIGTCSDSYADYSYASYRKWTGFEGIAVAKKKEGVFAETPHVENLKYTSIRRQAFFMKNKFIISGVGDKEKFLSLFDEAESLLEDDYVGYKPSLETMASFLSFDKSAIAKARRNNAAILMEGLKDIPEVNLMFSQLEQDDVPLFVPIIVESSRSQLRKYLIDSKIYCPIHWPLSQYHKGISERAGKVYSQELSLVCDQRYGSDDMLRTVDCIRKFYSR